MPNPNDLLGTRLVNKFGSVKEVTDIDTRGRGRITLTDEKTGRTTPYKAEQLDEQRERGRFRVLESEELTPDPRAVHNNRSEYAQAQDKARDARLTTDPDKYAADPNSFDFPGVDTGPTFREEQGDFDTDEFIEDTLGFDLP